MGINSLFNSLKLCLFSAQPRINLLVAILPKMQKSFHLSMSVIPFPTHCTDIVRHLFAPPPLFSLPFLSLFTLFISRAPTTTGQYEYEKRQPKIHAFAFISPWRQPSLTQILPLIPFFLPALTTTEQPAMSLHSFSFFVLQLLRDAVLPGCVQLRCSFPSCIPCPPEERWQKHYKACKNSLSRIASPLQRNGIAVQCKQGVSKWVQACKDTLMCVWESESVWGNKPHLLQCPGYMYDIHAHSLI